MRALLDALLADLGLGPTNGDAALVRFGGGVASSLDLTLRRCLAEAAPGSDPAQTIDVVVTLAARAPAIAHRPPGAAPSPAVLPPSPRPPASGPESAAVPAPVPAPASYAAPPVTGASPVLGPIAPPPTAGGRAASPDASLLNYVRRASVEYFTRMAPQAVFPLKVTLSPYTSDRKLSPDAARAVSETFVLDPSKWIEVEPVLPGCTVYPAKLAVPGGTLTAEARFWVVPQVRGDVPGAVYVRHGDQQRVVRLKITVAEPRRAAWTAAAALVLPYVSVVLKHHRLDFESQVAEGFPLYVRTLRWLLRTVGPTELCVALLAAAAALWLARRPKKATADDLDAPLYAA